MRNFLVCGMLMICLTAPGFSQATPGGTTAPKLTRSQLEKQHDLLMRWGMRWMEVNDRYHVFRRVMNLATPDQIDTIHQLRISPTQARDMLELVRDNLPDGPLDDAGWKELRRKITPKAEDILGPEQFDLLISLAPSPQQMEKIKAVLREASRTPEGALALEAADALSASLTPAQKRYLDPILDLTRPQPEDKAPSTPADTVSGGDATLERHLVLLKRTGLGDCYAELSPTLDYGLYLPQQYRVDGADPSVLAALSNSDGLPVRVLGRLHGDHLTVEGTRLIGLPSLLPVDGTDQVWRGRLPAKVVSSQPPTLELDAGNGRTIKAQLEIHNQEEQQAFNQVSQAGTPFLVDGTCLTGPDHVTLVDFRFMPWQPNAPNLKSAALIQASEEFLQHASQQFLKGHQDKLTFGQGDVSLKVYDIGLTVLDTTDNQIRLYGRAGVLLSGLEVAAGDFEVTVRPTFVNSRTQMTPVPGSLKLRLSYPVYASAPANWIKNLEAMMGEEYSQGASLPIPSDYADKITKTGLLTQAQLDGLQLFTTSTGDRRTGLISVVAPAAAGAEQPPINPLRSRIVSPSECAVALSDEAINDAIKAKIPGMLPIIREIPKDMQMNEGVRLTDVEIPELDLTFKAGQFVINNCRVDVHWSYLLFSGVEPGARFKGTATVSGSGDPMKLTMRLKIDSLEFISERILGEPPEQQAKQKADLIKTLEERAFEVTPPQGVPVKMLSDKTTLDLTAVDGTANPSELVIQGRLKP